MHFQLRFVPNAGLSLRDPEETALGRSIVRNGLALMDELGYEHFTFRKLAEFIHTTEASIYRYYENKHRLLLYLLNWYWSYLEHLLSIDIRQVPNDEAKIKRIVKLLSSEPGSEYDTIGFDKKALFRLVIDQSSKTYLTKEVNTINNNKLFHAYKDLVASVGNLFSAYSPEYPYPRSLASTLLEMGHFQYYFVQHLPRLTDSNGATDPQGYVQGYLEHLVLSSLNSCRK
jgi:AcrR family transcriptional regulator